jgi:tRNA U34 5-methylaminomethyl-2-thiouridine-forming methyltransferase MnmC
MVNFQKKRLKREFVKTGDGSYTLFTPELKETYHSINGAITESMHVFIGAGLNSVTKKKIHLLEIGLGTGLNALVSFIESENKNVFIDYTGIDLYPVDPDICKSLNYHEILGKAYKDIFQQMHECDWGIPFQLSDYFTICKLKKDITKEPLQGNFDLVYFDAFSSAAQPEMWTETVMTKIYDCMNEQGVFVTYSCKGSVRRTLQILGMKVEKLPGPAGKREMIKAVKI